MNRLLSQDEIDKAFRIAQEKGDDNAARRAPAYDFRRPDRIAKDQLRSIHLLHDNFARNLASSLSGYLRAYVILNLVSVEQLSFAEFTRDGRRYFTAVARDITHRKRADEALRRIDSWLCDLKDLAVKDGLHIYGRTPANADDPAWQASGEAERMALIAARDGRRVAPGPAGSPTRPDWQERLARPWFARTGGAPLRKGR